MYIHMYVSFFAVALHSNSICEASKGQFLRITVVQRQLFENESIIILLPDFYSACDEEYVRSIHVHTYVRTGLNL
jgi:hypothetical protein